MNILLSDRGARCDVMYCAESQSTAAVRYLCIQLDSLGSLQVGEWVFLWEKRVALIRGLQTIGSLEYSWGRVVRHSPQVWEVTNMVFCLLGEESYCEYLKVRSKKVKWQKTMCVFPVNVCVWLHTLFWTIRGAIMVIQWYGNKMCFCFYHSPPLTQFLSSIINTNKHSSFQSTTGRIRWKW